MTGQAAPRRRQPFVASLDAGNQHKGVAVGASRCHDGHGVQRFSDPSVFRVRVNLDKPAAIAELPSTEDGETRLDISEQASLVTRLNRVEGQIRGIRQMVQEPRQCIDILQQLAAAEAALNRISLAIFRHHIEHCVSAGMQTGESDCRKQLTELVDIFDRFAK